jgi:molybdate-binding protein/DNA-binding transcriptional regulator YhcF (GntR family)
VIPIQLSYDDQTPFYKQIAEQIKRLYYSNQLRCGDQMPTIRGLSKQLKVNPTTVARAYQELMREGILEAKCRRGTTVMGKSDNLDKLTLKQRRLSNTIYNFLLKSLSLGYNLEELETTFNLQLAKWCLPGSIQDAESDSRTASVLKTIRIIGSNDLALDLLISRLKYRHPDMLFHSIPAGSMGGLLAILEGTADMAGIHLLDEETGEYNIPHIKHTLQGLEVAVVHLVDRIQGLMVARDNPNKIQGLADLKRRDIRFTNRQKGSGTRVLLDYKLREMGIIFHNIKGYDREVDTHMEVAMSIVRGEADAGLGIQSVANSCNLVFIPIAHERFDLVIPVKNLQRPIFEELPDIVRSEEFKKVVNEMGGYDTSQTGETILVKSTGERE